MWHVLNTILHSENDLISARVATQLAVILMDFHRKHEMNFTEIAGDIGTLTTDLSERIDAAYAEAFSYEFAMRRSILFEPDMADLRERRWNLPDQLESYLYHWPFLDKYAVLRIEFDFFSEMIALSTDHSEQLDDRLGEVRQRISAERERKISLANPFGTSLINMATPDYTRFIEKKNKMIEKVIEFQNQLSG